jgi:hypothetical protein
LEQARHYGRRAMTRWPLPTSRAKLPKAEAVEFEMARAY